MLFSATFPRDARKLAKVLLADDHIRVRVGRLGSTHLNIKQNVRYFNHNIFFALLTEL